jgi:hypothetical protein
MLADQSGTGQWTTFFFVEEIDMQVFVKSGAIERHQIEKEVAKPVALGQLKDMVRREHVKATDPWYRSRMDPAEAAKNERNARRNLDRVIPETLTPGAQDAMWVRAKQLKDEFLVGMLSKEEMHPVRGVMRNGKVEWVVDEGKMAELRSVERETAWSTKNGTKIREFKNLMRHLCPEDAMAGDIERFRPRNRGIR